MATTFPTSLQDLDASRGATGNPLNSPNHITHHTTEDDTIEALQTKVGVDSSAVATSLDYLVKNTSSSNPGHKHTLANGATDVTASAAEVNILDGATLSVTELNYVDGVTSAIQTQIDTKAPSTAPTFATSITGSYLTASEMLITDASKNIVSAPVATYPSLTELTYLKGVTSAIQTQLNAAVSSFKNGTTTKDLSDASTTQNIAHGGGAIPKKVRITFSDEVTNNTIINNSAVLVYNGTTSSTIGFYYNGTGYIDLASGGNVTLHNQTAAAYQTGVVTFDATNIIITWTKTNSPTGTVRILWEAEF